MKIRDVELILLDVPLRPVAQRNMERCNHGWRIAQLCRVTLDNGAVGLGETLPNYTWGRVSPEAVARVKGRNPLEVMWDDSLGAGLQMALFDAVGKAAGVPAHALLGKLHRRRCPISWWTIDMSPEDCAAEARDAVAEGYMSMKQKGRPWFDVFEQVRLTCDAVPRDFKLDLDFNEHLVSAGNALPVLRELDAFPNLAIYEEPISRLDVEGNRKLRRQTRCAIAHHWLDTQAAIGVRDEVCDGYVVSGGASAVTRAAAYCRLVHKPMWLQLVGTGITTAWALHLGAVCAAAQWPAVTCMNTYQDTLLTKPLDIAGGFAAVPDGPGLGVELNESALRYRVSAAEKPNVKALYALVRSSGRKIWFHGEYGPAGYWTENQAGNLPPCEHGVTLQRWDDDGSARWRDLAQRVGVAPVWE